MDFKSYLKEAAGEIDQRLNDFLKQEITVSKKVSPKLVALVSLFATQSEGGKRLRAILVKLGYELFAPPNADIYQAALSYEIVQTSLLAHDDIIDKSLTRRGKPTMYQALGGDHYGISQTIILGDIGFFLAFRLIATSNFPIENKLKAIQSLNENLLKTGSGEMLDVELSLKPEEGFSEQDSIAVSHFKTAHYTIIGPLQLGAILAGASDEALKKIEDFGKNLGIAFQVQDDILGIYGEEETLGKSVTSDIEEGKPTLLYLEALKRADSDQKKLLASIYGKKNISSVEASQIRSLFEKLGSLDYAHLKAVEYVNLAKQAIPEITQEKEKQQLLEELADYLVEREK